MNDPAIKKTVMNVKLLSIRAWSCWEDTTDCYNHHFIWSDLYQITSVFRKLIKGTRNKATSLMFYHIPGRTVEMTLLLFGYISRLYVCTFDMGLYPMQTLSRCGLWGEYQFTKIIERYSRILTPFTGLFNYCNWKDVAKLFLCILNNVQQVYNIKALSTLRNAFQADQNATMTTQPQP